MTTNTTEPQTKRPLITPSGHGKIPILQSQLYVAETSTGWHRVAYVDVCRRLARGSRFPWVFAKNAYRRGLLKFIFVEKNTPNDVRYLAVGLAKYVRACSNWNGDLGTAYPLVVAFSKEAIESTALEAYHAFGWWILQRNVFEALPADNLVGLELAEFHAPQEMADSEAALRNILEVVAPLLELEPVA